LPGGSGVLGVRAASGVRGVREDELKARRTLADIEVFSFPAFSPGVSWIDIPQAEHLLDRTIVVGNERSQRPDRIAFRT
jgi:hypothetical protein